MSEKQFKELTKRLDTLIKLTAMNALQGKSMTEQVGILSELGLKPKEIASLLGTTPHSVSVMKGEFKKRKGRAKRKRKRSKKKGGEPSGENK